MAIRIGGFPNLRPAEVVTKSEQPAAAATVKEFGQFLSEALGKVEEAQQDAANAAQRLAAGEVRDISGVTIASEKASLALQLTVQVRNKVLEAYQEIMRMPV